MSSVISKLTKANKAALINEALNAAEELGYCSETINVLERMGFDVDSQRNVTIKVSSINQDLPITFNTDSFSAYLCIEDDRGNMEEIYDLEVEVTRG